MLFTFEVLFDDRVRYEIIRNAKRDDDKVKVSDTGGRRRRGGRGCEARIQLARYQLGHVVGG